MKLFLTATALFLGAVFFASPLNAEEVTEGNILKLAVSGPGSVSIAIKNYNSGETEKTEMCSAKECTVAIAGGKRVDLLPLPGAQAKFNKWSGLCTRSSLLCSFTIDPEVTGETVETAAAFSFLNEKKPYFKKTKSLTSRALMMQTGCGGKSECSLVLTGYLRGAKPKRLAIEPIFFDLAASERRTLNVIAGSENSDVRKKIQAIAKEGKRARLFVRLTDITTKQTQGMAINEKPRCCFDKPNKPNR